MTLSTYSMSLAYMTLAMSFLPWMARTWATSLASGDVFQPRAYVSGMSLRVCRMMTTFSVSWCSSSTP